MADVYEIVKDMKRNEKLAYFKTTTPDEKREYNENMRDVKSK